MSDVMNYINSIVGNIVGNITGGTHISDALKEYAKQIELMSNLISKYGNNPNYKDILKETYNKLRDLSLILRIKVGGNDKVLDKVADDYNKKYGGNYDKYQVFFNLFEKPLREFCIALTSIGLKGECQPAYPSELGAIPAVIGVAKMTVSLALLVGATYGAYKITYMLTASEQAKLEQAKSNRMLVEMIMKAEQDYKSGNISKEEYNKKLENYVKGIKEVSGSNLSKWLLFTGLGIGIFMLYKKRDLIIKRR